MAVRTPDLIVFPIQRVSCTIVIKILHPVLTIMARKAIWTEISSVSLGKIRLMISMTIEACLIFHMSEGLTYVTGGTFHWGCIVIHLVIGQAEIGYGMIE
jgi:hypothetical protein